MKVTIRERYLCAWCGRKVKDIDANKKRQYCNETHERLHEEWKETKNPQS